MRILAATESELTAAPDADPAGRRTPEPRESRRVSARTLTIVRRTAITAWALGLLWWFYRVGITFDRNTLLLYVCAGLFAASIGRRRTMHVLRDWLPFAAVLVVYDLSRGAADALGRPTEWHLQLDFDRWLFAGVEPTVWLQSQLKEPFPPWWEVGVSIVYVSYFLAPWALAGVLWLRDRQAWRRFAARFVVISFIGLACFVAFPAAPPWAASQCTAAEVVDGPSDPPCIDAEVGTLTTGGMLGKVHPHHGGAAAYAERIATRGWNKLGIPQAKALVDEGQAGSNQVAAVPSLHAAIAFLVTVFFWPRVRRRWRPLLAAYSVAMAFSLVYSAEHYIFDILLGWLITAVVSVGFTRWERRRADRADRSAGSGPAGDGEKPLAATDTLGGPLPGRP